MTSFRPSHRAILCALLLAVLVPSVSSAQSWFRRGDAGGDGRVDIDDAIFIQNYLFLAGPAPLCFQAADANDDDVVDNLDGIYIISWTSTGGPPPPAPGPSTCGPDPTVGILTCATYSCPFIRGDADGNGTIDAADATAINNYLFLGGALPCFDAADANDDGAISSTDAIFLLSGATIPLPGPLVCGPDYTTDGLDCQMYSNPPVFVRGDTDGDGIVSLNDSTVLLNYLFSGGALGCIASGDADANGIVFQTDSIYILNYVNLGGPPPPAPFPVCGLDATTTLSCIQKQCAFIRGDADGNGQLEVADATLVSSFLLTGFPVPPCLDAADADDDGMISVADGVAILTAISGGAPIPAPGPHVCGIDPTADSLNCASYTCLVPNDFSRGDCNVDTNFDIADPIFILGVLFPPMGVVNTASCQDACDANDDGLLNIADPIRMLNRIFGGGAPLPAPYRTCGYDPTAIDPLGCVTYSQAGCP